MTKLELFTELESRLYYANRNEIIKLLCDCFSSDIIKEFLDHVKDEGYKKQL